MTATDALVKVSEWLNSEVCPYYKFKKEPDIKAPIDKNYDYEMVNPHAFPMFIPARDKLPPGVKVNMPSVCVQMLEVSDDVPKGKRDVSIQLGICTWNPGVHSQDIYYPKGADVPEGNEYRSGYDGWMDVWNFMDGIVRKIESMTGIEGLYLSPDASVKMGPAKEQEVIPDYYPHWFGYIQFTLCSDFTRYNADVEQYL